MNSEYKIINQLISSAVFQGKSDFSNEADWNLIYQEMSKQTIKSIIGDILPNLPKIDNNLKMQWKSDIVGQVNHYIEYLYEQDKIVKLLSENEIPFVIIKGVSVSFDYPKPEYRTLGDIDLLTLPEYIKKIDDLFLNADFAVKEKSDKHRHNTYVNEKCEIELHWSFDTKTESNEISALDEFLFEGVKNADWVSLDGYKFPRLPVFQQGIVLLQHMMHHMRYGFGYRQFTDWIVFADKYLNNEIWKNTFEKKVKKFGLDKFAKTVTKTGVIYFNLNEDDFLWCKDVPQDVCKEFMEYIINCGNMGRKLDENKKGLSRALRKYTPLELVKNLQSFGEKNWVALRKHKWLKPFAWLYQICRFIKKGILQPKSLSLKRVSDDKKRKNRVDKLCEKMGIKG